MKVAGFAFMLAVVVASASIAQPEQAGPALPAEVVGVLEIVSPEAFQDHLAQLTEAVAPGKQAPGLFGMLAGGLVKSFSPGIIDDAAPFRVFLVAAPEGEIRYVAAFTSKGAGAYRATLYPRLKKAEERDGMTVFSDSKTVFDMKAFKKATPEEQQDKERFFSAVERQFAIMEEGDVILAGNVPEMLPVIRGLVADGVIGADRLLPGEEDIAFRLDMAAVCMNAAEREGGLLGSMKEMALAMGLQGDDAKDLRTREILEAEFDLAEQGLAQLSEISAGLTLSAEAERVRLGVGFLEETPLALYLAGVATGVPETLKYLPDDVSTLAALRSGEGGALKDMLEGFQQTMSKLLGDAGAGDIGDLYMRSSANIAGEFVMGLRKSDRLSFVQAVRVDDPELAREVAQRSVEMFQAAMGMMGEAPEGLEITSETVEHNGHEIIRTTVVLPTGPEGKPVSTWQPGQPMGIAEMYGMMMGDRFDICATLLDKDQVSVTGADALEVLKKVLDGDYRRAVDTERFKALIETLPEDSIGFASVDVADIMAIGLRFAQQALPIFPRVNVQFEQGPGSTAVLRRIGTGASLDVEIPIQEIQIVVDGFTKMFEDMKRQQQAAQQEQKGPEPPRQ